MPDLSTHVGTWEGSWSTFLEPNQPYDESPIEATISYDGDTVVISYVASIAGEAVTGTLRWAEDGDTTTVEWSDSWHTAGKTEHLVGTGGAPPSYEYSGDDPWVWDTLVEATDSGVTITHHNAGPGAGVPRYLGSRTTLDTRAI